MHTAIPLLCTLSSLSCTDALLSFYAYLYMLLLLLLLGHGLAGQRSAYHQGYTRPAGLLLFSLIYHRAEDQRHLLSVARNASNLVVNIVPQANHILLRFLCQCNSVSIYYKSIRVHRQGHDRP
jgi:hypothetical protein